MTDSTNHVFVVGMVTATVTVLSESESELVVVVGVGVGVDVAASPPRRLRTILHSVRTIVVVIVEGGRESVVVVVVLFAGVMMTGYTHCPRLVNVYVPSFSQCRWDGEMEWT
jgi:hypothetical protein